jgi:hypothetical protein
VDRDALVGLLELGEIELAHLEHRVARPPGAIGIGAAAVAAILATNEELRNKLMGADGGQQPASTPAGNSQVPVAT